jgi:cytochrome c553
VPSLAGQPRLFVENQLVLIREGLRVVPEMKGLLDGVDDETIVKLATYFAGQKPPAASTSQRDAASFERGKAIAGRMHCGSCHLPDYRGQQQVPRVAGQHERFLLATMRQLRDHPGPGRDTIMAASLRGLTDRDLADVAHFLALSD